MRRRQFVLGLVVFAGLAGMLSADDDDDDEGNPVETTITVEGEANGKLTAKYILKEDGRRTLRVEVENLDDYVGSTLTVSVVSDGTSSTVGTFLVSTDGAGAMEKRTSRGNSVPTINDGDRLVVSSSGTEVLAGSF